MKDDRSCAQVISEYIIIVVAISYVIHQVTLGDIRSTFSILFGDVEQASEDFVKKCLNYVSTRNYVGYVNCFEDGGQYRSYSDLGKIGYFDIESIEAVAITCPDFQPQCQERGQKRDETLAVTQIQVRVHIDAKWFSSEDDEIINLSREIRVVTSPGQLIMVEEPLIFEVPGDITLRIRKEDMKLIPFDFSNSTSD